MGVESEQFASAKQYKWDVGICIADVYVDNTNFYVPFELFCIGELLACIYAEKRYALN